MFFEEERGQEESCEKRCRTETLHSALGLPPTPWVPELNAIALGRVLASRLWNDGLNISLSSQALQRLGSLARTSQLAIALTLL